MQQEKFQALVKKLEKVAEQNPRGYKARVAALAVMGYGFIFLMLTVLMALLIGVGIFLYNHHGLSFAGAKIFFFLLILVYAVARSLWVKMEPPGGLPLTREQTPALFALIDDVAQRLNSPPPDVVLLTDDFNCAVAQVPRLGIFGMYRSYLLLGLPMLHALSPEEFKGVLAHEFGHLSGNHGRFSGWIYRVRATWYQLLASLEGHHGQGLFRWFFNWYAPYFGAYSFVLARADEYVADRCAVEIAGRRVSADMLVRVNVVGSYLDEKFWPGVYRQANTQAAPPSPFTNLKGLLASYEGDAAQRWMNRAMSAETGEADTHPSLTDRLKAIGEEPRLPPALAATAADAYLGAALNELTGMLNTLWGQTVAPAWQQRHEEQQEAQKQLRELDEKAARGEELSEDEALQRAAWHEEFGESEDESLQELEAFVARYPANAAGLFLLGRLLLNRGQERGIELLNQSMAADAEATLPCCELIYGYLCERGRRDEAQAYLKKAMARGEWEYEAALEREGIGPGDKLLPHEITSEQLQELRTALAAQTRLKTAYLARKALTHEGPPLYILALRYKSELRLVAEDEYHKMAAELMPQLPLPGECFVIALHSGNEAFEAPLKRVPGAKIYPQGD